MVLILLAVLSDSVFCSDEPSRPNGTARMCIEYEREDPQSLKKPVNLLDALEHSDHSRRKEDEEKVPSSSHVGSLRSTHRPLLFSPALQ